MNTRVLSDSTSGIVQIANGGHTIKNHRERATYIKELMNTCETGPATLEHVIQLADPLTKAKKVDWYSQPAAIKRISTK